MRPKIVRKYLEDKINSIKRSHTTIYSSEVLPRVLVVSLSRQSLEVHVQAPQTLYPALQSSESIYMYIITYINYRTYTCVRYIT